MKKKVVIIGAGPAGLSAGYTLLKNSYETKINAYDYRIYKRAK